MVPGFTDGIGDFWTNISILPSSNVLAGTISISDILKSLIWHGVITGQEYLSGIEFGPEPGAGSGSLLVNNLSYQWNGTPTVELTAGNDTFKIATPGGNDVVGNGGQTPSSTMAFIRNFRSSCQDQKFSLWKTTTFQLWII